MTQSVKLRDYQEEGISKVFAAHERGVKRQLGVAATGLGKTIVFSSLAERHVQETDGRVLILAHRDELINQAADKLLGVWKDADVGICKAARNEIDHQVVVASVQTLSRSSRLEQIPADHFSLIITDEAHHGTSASYKNIYDYFGVGSIEGPLSFGVTATPDRGDGKGLEEVFDEIVFNYDMLWGIRAGYLSDLRGLRVYLDDFTMKGVKTSKGDFDPGQTAQRLQDANAPELIVEAWMKYASDRKTIVFTPTVAVANDIAEAFKAEGISAEMISGNTQIDERRDMLRRFSVGEIQVLCNAQLLTEGFDEPSVDCIVMARPTKSRAWYVQCVGRGVRKFPGKEDALVIDVVGVSDHHSLVTIPSLFGIENESKFEKMEATVATVMIEEEEERVRKGELQAAGVELFKKVLESKISWTTFSGSDGRLGYICQLGERDKGTVVIEPANPMGEEIPTWHTYIKWDRGYGPGGPAVRTFPSGESIRTLITDTDIETAQGVGEDYVRKNGVSHLVDKDAPWRARRPSDKQLGAAAKWKLKVDPAWNAGELSDALGAHIENKKRKSRNTPQWVKDDWKRKKGWA